MSQTSYPTAAALAYSGLIADIENCDILSRINSDPAVIPFGVAVVAESADGVDLPTASGDIILGVSAHSHAYALPASPTGIPVGEMVNVLRQGVVWVAVEDAVTQGSSSVYVRHGGVGQLGAFRGADDGANASLLANARYLTSTSGAGFAQLELRGSVGAMS